MLPIIDHFFRAPIWGRLWIQTFGRCASVWNFIARVLFGEPKNLVGGSKAGESPAGTTAHTPPRRAAPPKEIRYKPIPGSWQRRERPNWPESVFQVSDEAPFGTIYYVTKGEWAGSGATAHVERLPSGHIIKYPKSNPYSPVEEEDHRACMRTEAEPAEADDVFALGSVLYFIMVGAEPYDDLDEDEAQRLFERAEFPSVEDVPCGSVIRGCWTGALPTAERVLNALNSLVSG